MEEQPDDVASAAAATRGQPPSPAVAMNPRVSRRTKLLYGIGETGEGITTAALETFLFFYYIQVVGLSGALTGAALLIALLVDAVIDPWVGAWSDGTRTRLGRRHPFLYAAPVPLAVALVFLFMPPADLSHILQFAWLTVFAILARVALTLYFIPHMALGAELSQDFKERVTISGYRVLFSYVGRLVALVLAFAVFFRPTSQFHNGQLNPEVYGPFAIACGLLVILLVIGSALGTQRAALRVRAPAVAHAEAPAGAWNTFIAAMRSPSFRALFFALLAVLIYGGVQAALALHMNTYFWRLEPSQVQLVFYTGIAGNLIGIPLAAPLAARFDKKHAWMICVLLPVTITTMPVVLRDLGLFPQNGQPEVLYLLMAAQLLTGIVWVIPSILSAAMLADLADEYELVHGDRTEGVFFGVNAFCRKASLGVGGALAGLIIDWIRFPAKVDPRLVPTETLNHLGLAYLPATLPIIALGLFAMRGYQLDRQQHAALMAALHDRNAVAGVPPAR
jgi:glycoside/pentoside/hexuronide:cation symporter, GPH family